MTALTVNDVFYEYRNAYQTVKAVNGVSCQFEQGKVYAITGASGSGKTTLLSLLAGLDLPTKGTIELDGVSTRKLRRNQYRLNHVSVIYQNYNLFYHLTVLENAAYPLYIRRFFPQKGQYHRQGNAFEGWSYRGSVPPDAQYAFRRRAAAGGHRQNPGFR